MEQTRAPPPDGASPALQAVLARSEGAGSRPSPLRDEIVRSWERCARAGLRPDRFEVPYDADVAGFAGQQDQCSTGWETTWTAPGSGFS